MNRWIAFAATALVLCTAAQAQVVIRTAPANVKPGQMVVTLPPQITMDGRPDRLSPGARIRSTQNMQLLSGSVVGQQLPVIYRRDSFGLVHEVWVLTPDEYSKIARAADGTQEGEQRLHDLLNRIFSARR